MQVTPNEVTDEKDGEGGAWPTAELEVVQHVLGKEKDASQELGEWYEAAKKDFAFAETKQWSEEDAAKLESEKRVAVTFNLVHRTVNSICGQEVANRQEVKFLPRRVGEVHSSDPMTDAVKWFRDGCNAEDEDSDAFRDMVICGMGWTCTRMDYEVNQEGEPVVERRDPLLMRWDTSARRKNLADKKWVQADYWMDKAAIQERWPDAEMDALNLSSGPTNLDNQPVDATENWKYKTEAAGYEKLRDLFRVIHHVERYTVAVHRVLDPSTQKIMSLSEAEFKTLKERATQAGMPEPQSVPGKKRVYWEAWTVGKTRLASGVAKIQNGFQYECMTCVRERETGFWFGVVRLMIDPQRYANRMASLMMSILATGAKGGFMFETGAFANVKKAKQDWARHDSAIEINPGFLDRVIPKPQMAMPPGAAEMMQFALSSIRDVPGVNLEMLGQQTNDQPGVVEDMRTKAGLVILACVFDAKRLYVKRQGIILAEFVTKFLSDGRLIRIWGQNGQQFIPLVRDPEVVEYDLVVDESPASRDVKERTYHVMRELGPMLMQMGIPLPPEALDYLPVPESLALAIKKSVAQKMQQPPQPPPEVQKVQAEGQIHMQVETMKGQQQERALQVKAQAEAQLEQVRAETTRQAEAARLEADVRVAQHAAEMKAQNDRYAADLKAQGEMQKIQFEQWKIQAQQDFERWRVEQETMRALAVAEISQQTTLQSAQMTAANTEARQ